MARGSWFRCAAGPAVRVLTVGLGPLLAACGSGTESGPGPVDLAVSMVASAATARVGETVTYAISVTNAGPAAAEPVGFTAWLTAEDALRDVAGEGWRCQAHTGNFVTCERALLEARASTSLKMTRKAATPGPLVNTVQVDAKTQVDEDTGNNRATVTVQVE